MARVLVTGGAGFIGLHLAEALLARGDEVVVVDNFTRGKNDAVLNAFREKKGVTFITVDLTDPQALLEMPIGMDEIYHLAALNGTKHFYERPVDVFRANLLSTISLLDWFHKHNGRGRFLFSSSSETYAGAVAAGLAPVPTPEVVPLIVDDPRNVRWSYGGSKIAAEVLIQAYVHQYQLPIVTVRYHNIYGPRMGEEHVVPQFIRRAQQHADPFDIFGGTETRAFCFVDDAVRGTMLAMGRGSTGGVYHLGVQDEMSIAQLAKDICSLVGYEPTFNVQPAPPGSVPRRAPDITKAKQELGYEPSVSLNKGLQQTIAWYSQTVVE